MEIITIYFPLLISSSNKRSKVLDRDFYKVWIEKFEKANAGMVDRDLKVAAVIAE